MTAAAYPLVLLLSLLLFAAPGRAQVLNVERVRTDSDTTGLIGEVGFDLSLNKHKARVLKTGGHANASYFTGQNQYLLLSQLDLVNLDGNSLVSNGYAHLRATFLRKSRLSPEVFTQYQYNNTMGLLNRALGGAGVRLAFLSRPSLSGHVATGLMYEFEEWDVRGEASVTRSLVKSTSNVVVRGQLNPQASLTTIGYYQARPGRFLEPRATSENQLNVRLSRSLTFRVSFTMTYDVEPVVEVPNLTYELKNGLVFSF